MKSSEERENLGMMFYFPIMTILLALAMIEMMMMTMMAWHEMMLGDVVVEMKNKFYHMPSQRKFATKLFNKNRC